MGFCGFADYVLGAGAGGFSCVGEWGFLVSGIGCGFLGHFFFFVDAGLIGGGFFYDMNEFKVDSGGNADVIFFRAYEGEE